MIRGQPSEQMGKNVPQKRSSKCSGSEVIVLRMIQRKKELAWLVVIKQQMAGEGGQGLPHAGLCQLS